MPSYVKLMDDSVQLFNAKLKIFIESFLSYCNFGLMGDTPMK